jgi:Asp-tRNA(Asn)/Glu-tRNA(Gln) amidotransferase A subunit family amidase
MDSVEGKDYLNAPIGLQLVARRYHDEELMKALKIVERILKS